MENVYNFIYPIYVFINILISLLLIAYFFEDRFCKEKKFPSIYEQVIDTVREQSHRIYILASISVCGFLTYKYLGHNGEHFFAVCLEFAGVIALFLIVEHVIKSLKSGIQDPDNIPLDKFISDINDAKKGLILFDTVFEKLLLEKYFEKLKAAIETACKNNKEFKVRILMMAQDHRYFESPSQKSDKKKDDYNKQVESGKIAFINMAEQICGGIYRDRIQILDYTELPSFSMYAIDDKAYVSFFPTDESYFPPNMKSTDSPQLYIPNNTDLGKEVYTYFFGIFEKIWENNIEK